MQWMPRRPERGVVQAEKRPFEQNSTAETSKSFLFQLQHYFWHKFDLSLLPTESAISPVLMVRPTRYEQLVVESVSHGQRLCLGSRVDPTPFPSRNGPITQKRIAIPLVYPCYLKTLLKNGRSFSGCWYFVLLPFSTRTPITRTYLGL